MKVVSVVVKKETRGRKKHSNVKAGVQQTMDTAGPLGAQYLLDALSTKGKLDWQRIDIAKFSVEQSLGKAKQKIEIDSPINSYLAIIALAEKAEQALLPLQLGIGDDIIEGKEEEDVQGQGSTEGSEQTSQPKV